MADADKYDGEGVRELTAVRLLSSGVGRGVRIVVGLVLLGVGLIYGGWLLLVGALGVVFIVLGAANICLLGPLFGAPLVRTRAHH